MQERDDNTIPRARAFDELGVARGTIYLRLVYAEALAWDAREIHRTVRFSGTEAGTLLIGRAPVARDGSRVLGIPYDSWASRRHAQLRLLRLGDEDGIIVEDLGSRNGTYIDGHRLHSPTLARPGQILRVGSTIFVVARAPMEEAERLQRKNPAAPDFDTRSWCALQLWDQLSSLARSNEPVLLLGEVGTGKTRLARNLHRLSAQSAGPFISYNCSAIPHNLEEATLFGVVGGFIPTVKEKKGWLTLAAGGTLFLDELADMPLLAQAKMLDAFDPTEPSYVPVGGTRRVPTTCRLVSATNRDVFSIANQGLLRHDLLSRLVVAQVTVPALRDRREDLLAIYTSALERAGGLFEGKPVVPNAEVAETMLTARWVENVRGLESLARRAAIGETVSSAVVRKHADRAVGERVPTTPGIPVAQAARTLTAPARTVTAPARAGSIPTLMSGRPIWPPNQAELLKLLADHDWNVTVVADVLHKRRETVQRLIKKLFGGGVGAARELWREKDVEAE